MDDLRCSVKISAGQDRLLVTGSQRKAAPEACKTIDNEHLSEALDHMRFMEMMTMPNVDCMRHQPEVSWAMRLILLDFLLSVHQHLSLLPETLFLAVNLLDRYASIKAVRARHYQLLGCAALLVAAKYGDRKSHVPTAQQLASLCGIQSSKMVILQMEEDILKTLNWTIGHPTIMVFLHTEFSDPEDNQEFRDIALYISELVLFDQELMFVRASVMATISVAAARRILGVYGEDRRERALVCDGRIAARLFDCLSFPSLVLHRKYATVQFSYASLTVQEFTKKGTKSPCRLDYDT